MVSVERPAWPEMARAVTGLSPVIISTWMLAERANLIASRTSGRGGLIRPTRPRKVMTISSMVLAEVWRLASAMTRSPSTASVSQACRMRVNSSPLWLLSPVGVRRRVETVRIASDASLMRPSQVSTWRDRTLIRFRSDGRFRGFCMTCDDSFACKGLGALAFLPTSTDSPSRSERFRRRIVRPCPIWSHLPE